VDMRFLIQNNLLNLVNMILKDLIFHLCRFNLILLYLQLFIQILEAFIFFLNIPNGRHYWSLGFIQLIS
jgi:hypothetical protein